MLPQSIRFASFNSSSKQSLTGTTGNLVKGPIDEDGKLKSAALLVGVKLDLEAEVHLSARVRGDIVVGLY
ncbi:hypothetical protein RRF57_013158 [Xylaria bambusicola]|uniref:Uncharacterized protein n=1 Tax=Xylaria bambusicola TaxID=326684 RepID=A0AAN7V0H0_9PEZI